MGNPKNKGEKWGGIHRHNISDAKSKKATAMRRPSTHPELLDRAKPAMERTPWLNLEMPPHLTKMLSAPESSSIKTSAKLLVNVTVAQSIGPLRLLISTEATVLDVIKAALALYAKEGRKPILGSDPLSFGLHYSQFSIDCLNPNDKIKDLGSRNFFMCPNAISSESNVISQASNVTCGSEMQKIFRARDPWWRLMDCFLSLP
ncbi:hypothetical protein SUGI_0978160 [Cryptomeria japonica]|uniref:uncharacterized protein At4g22758 n=1 Tax=Cryptomeria japonica TaxID=3369 RepID=UPI00241478AA|nr:uncharacterized protein At4g22758 [Cryptomeria japonica]GLJ46412.1 hypothetical protein SUGI_0978160 [Cryptomeria japonica]